MCEYLHMCMFIICVPVPVEVRKWHWVLRTGDISGCWLLL